MVKAKLLEVQAQEGTLSTTMLVQKWFPISIQKKKNP
jgi:hypothetical protein